MLTDSIEMQDKARKAARRLAKEAARVAALELMAASEIDENIPGDDSEARSVLSAVVDDSRAVGVIENVVTVSSSSPCRERGDNSIPEILHDMQGSMLDVHVPQKPTAVNPLQSVIPDLGRVFTKPFVRIQGRMRLKRGTEEPAIEDAAVGTLNGHGKHSSDLGAAVAFDQVFIDAEVPKDTVTARAQASDLGDTIASDQVCIDAEVPKDTVVERALDEDAKDWSEKASIKVSSNFDYWAWLDPWGWAY
jgi:hypothetical protein